MNIRSLFAAFIFLAAFSFTSYAQACGGYGVTIFVHDNELNTVKNYSLSLAPLGKDELDGVKFIPDKHSPGASTMPLRENGRYVNGKYKLTVFAPGFIVAEKVITFPYCEDLVHNILLLKPGQARAVATGKVIDAKGVPVPYAEVIFNGAANTLRRVHADIDGVYEIKLPPGDHIMWVKSVRGVPLLEQQLTVPASGKAELNILIKNDEDEEN